MKILVKCLTCGKEFTGQECYQKLGKEKYCSKACYYKSPHPPSKKRTPNIHVRCPQCGKEFLTKEFRIKDGRGKFCSQSCRAIFTQTGKPNPSAKLNILKAIEAIKGKPAWNRDFATITCQTCGKSFEVGHARRNNAKFCGWECFSKSKTLVTGLNHPLYTRKPRNCEYCGKEVWVKPAKLQEFRFCSRQCLGSWVTSHIHHPTSPERIIAESLKALSIPFEAEYRIGRYSCDFALPQYHIVIEADGDYWHSLPKRKALDIVKDKYLREQGWQVFRFKECDIKSNLTRCLIKINKHIALF